MTGLPIDLEKITLHVALGSIFALGVFLCIDSINQSFLGSFEHYVSTSSFGVVAAIPLLAVLYLLGAFISLSSDMVFQAFNSKGYKSEWILMGEVIKSNNEILASKFTELYVQKKILEGSVAPLIVLAIGIYLERINLPTLSTVLMYTSIGIAVLAISVPLFTTQIRKRMDALIKMNKDMTPMGK